MKSFKKVSLFFILTLLVTALVACGNEESQNDNEEDNKSNNSSENQSNEESNEGSGSIVVGGSSALQPLAAAASEKFMEKNPDAQINVQGGGSGTGLSEVDAGNFDIGNADYFAESKEGIDADSLVDHKVAVVGMTAAVNPEVGVNNLSKEDLKKIWTGEIENWKEVGGEDMEITTVNRPDGSGTRATFVQFGLDGEKPESDITEDSSNRVKKIVADTPGAIGYLAFSYFNDDSVVKMSIDGVEATDKKVQSGDFPIWAYQHMYTKGEPKGLEKTFLDYMMSDEVQNNLVPEQGYIASTKMEVERDAEGNETSKDSNSDVSENVSGSIVVGGSSALQPLAAAASEKYMEKNSDAQINVQGGGSGTGLSEVDAGNFDIGNADYFAESKEGIDADSLVDHKVAVVGMTAAVNPEVGVNNLSKEDLKKIWTGEIENWEEVGGKDMEIITVNRPDGSGTRATFVQFGLDGEKPKSDITEDSSNRVKKIVADTPGAIGYLAFSYFNDDSVVKMSIDGIEATDKKVQSGDFPIWAYQHMYTKGEPKGLEKAFLDYMMSDEVQNNLVPEQGYIASTKMEVERDAEGNESNK